MQIKWKKHKEAYKKHLFIIYGKWDKFESYKKIIEETKEDGNDEEKKMKQYDDYQIQNVWRKSMQNLKLINKAKDELSCNVFFVNDKEKYKELIKQIP